MMLFLMCMLFAMILGILFYHWLKKPQYQSPGGDDLALYISHAHYENKTFYNLTHHPSQEDRSEPFTTLLQFFLHRNSQAIPLLPVPSHKTNLHQLDRCQNLVIWMGHSTCFIQLDGLRFLIDPVFSDNASPVPKTNRAFAGSNIYQVEDIPVLDYLLITHDHWDHLDYPTVKALHPKVRHVVTAMGIGSYLRQWGYKKEQIHECDWYQTIQTGQGLAIIFLPSHHFSGRLIRENRTLWGSFALLGSQKIYLSGDSGYSSHFDEIGQQYGPFDIAVLECGQYDQSWPDIHMFPEQTAQAAVDLQAKVVIPQHNSKFKLANHDWNEPLDRIVAASDGKPYCLLTPMIGQTVDTCLKQQYFHRWWHEASPVNVQATCPGEHSR
ncbi:MAG: hypothetical protein CENE_02267 [Candidatus Celerinatantimonas neptuna]|nr:MAG: hypothetical protein CENE_02267 [Candidatus Celerinatantimonas neptuna]